jgi:hypothetical protein
MSECHNHCCSKRKFVDGFPLVKEGSWRYESKNYTISAPGGKPTPFTVNIDLNFISQGCGFLFGDNTVNPTSKSDIMGVWKETCNSYDLYIVQDRPDNGTIVVSPSKYDCGEVVEFRGIFIEPGFSPGNNNQAPSVGQIKVYWKSDPLVKKSKNTKRY